MTNHTTQQIMLDNIVKIEGGMPNVPKDKYAVIGQAEIEFVKTNPKSVTWATEEGTFKAVLTTQEFGKIASEKSYSIFQCGSGKVLAKVGVREFVESLPQIMTVRHEIIPFALDDLVKI